MEFVTHQRNENEYQLLKDHLYGVAERAAMFAKSFGGSDHAYRAGLLHDIGKYSIAAQKRQRDPEHTVRVDHSTAGAQEAFSQKDFHAAFAIAGHHGGLPNMGSKASCEDGTLFARQKKELINELDASVWKNEIQIPNQIGTPSWLATLPRQHCGFANAMYTRMLFSCLVDADYLDTEAFLSSGSIQRGYFQQMDELLVKLQKYVKPWLSESNSSFNRERSQLLKQCLQGARAKRGLYTLTIPTGGGKTVSSLAFALSHAVQHQLKRVIYVIPYTSIIEQNAQVFRNILGENAVLEHHSNAEFDDEQDNVARLATENWDAPVVVTTAVQFFESLFAAKTSRCRKLHNIADSVVIFDEAQMLPVSYLRPCVDAIVELVQHYGVTAVLCTATQPSLNGLIQDYAPCLEVQEIIPHQEKLFEFFCRVNFEHEGCKSIPTLADHLSTQKQVLCIVNARKTAAELFHVLNDEEGCFHLSTLMTPDHRSLVLKEIRKRLAENLPCRVVSTSLIEAGVDVDFPSVWREEAGLDSILQAAGRCNREGRYSPAESIVHIFHFEKSPPKQFAQNIYAMRKALELNKDPSSLQAIKAYFQYLLFVLGEQALDAKQILNQSNQLAFQDIQDSFKIIETQTIPVYIPTPENEHLLQELREGRPTRNTLRLLGRSAVSIYPQHFNALKNALECPMGDRFGILLDCAMYSEHCGLMLEPEYGDAWFC